MLFIIIYNSIYNMLFNYPPVSFTLSDILPLISPLSPHHSLYSISPCDLSSLSRSLSRLSLDLSLLSPPQERKQREIRRERSGRETEERAYMCLETENHRLEMSDENQHDREPPEVVRLLLSTKESYVFFFLLDAERGDDCKIARGRASEFGGIFFAIDLENMWGL